MSKSGHAYVYKGKKMPGLTRRMKKTFFPHYEGVRRHRSSRSGRDTGTRVHRQLYHVIDCIGRKKGVCDCTIKTNLNRLHKYTKQALAKMKELGIEPKASEVHILCKRAGVGTSLDIIGTRWGKRSVIISIKTGYACGYDKNLDGQMMKSPLRDIECTLKQQNQLQGMLEITDVQIEYGLEFDDYVILYLGHGESGEAQEEYLERWCNDPQRRKSVYDAFTRN